MLIGDRDVLQLRLAEDRSVDPADAHLETRGGLEPRDAVDDEAMARRGEVDAALELVEECVEQIERPGWQERLWRAEVLRLKGWMLLQLNRQDEAELQLRASIACAREQGAHSWELRSATTLATLLASRGERQSAYDLLQPTYAWFTEGFDTPDLRDARALLQQLGASSATDAVRTTDTGISPASLERSTEA